MKNMNNCQITKVQPQVFLIICLIFCQFQPGVAYKCCLQEKSVYFEAEKFRTKKSNQRKTYIYFKKLLLCLIVGGGANCKSLGKSPQVHLIIIRE